MKEIEYDYVSATFNNISAENLARGFVTGNPTITEINQRATADSEEIIKAVAKKLEEKFLLSRETISQNFENIVVVGFGGSTQGSKAINSFLNDDIELIKN